MPTFAENRGNLSNAATMLLIGGIPPGHVADTNFQPQVCSYGLHDTFYVMSSYPGIQYCDKVDAADGDTVPTTGVCLPWPGGNGEVLTIENGVLRTSSLAIGEVMLLRNGSPDGRPATLKDAIFIDPNLYQLQVLEGCARLQLKWGDVIVVKSAGSSFFSVGRSFPSVAPLVSVRDDWVVYVCLPEFYGGPEAYNALRMPGVARSVRERVEEFISVWDASWDPTINRVIFARNGPRQQALDAFIWDAIEDHTAGVTLPGPWWANPSDDGDSALDELSALALSGGKRSAEDSDGDAGGKRRK